MILGILNNKSVFILFFTLLSASKIYLQGAWYGVKLGGAMNVQSWGNGEGAIGINRDPMFSFNGDVFVESLDEFKKGSLYAQIGFHTRGSSLRFFGFNNDFNTQLNYKFHNIVLEAGAKKFLKLGKDVDPYFILGIRAEYTVGNNFTDLLTFNTLVYPEFIRKFNYGVTFGGGFEAYLNELSNIFLEFSIQPDLSFQYEQFPLVNVVNPFPPFDRINLPQTQVRNLSIEAKVGIRFLRKVEYIDE